EEARLAYLQAEVTRQRELGNNDLAGEIEIMTTDFTLARDGTRVARYPTRLGNIITEYEEYATRKYDADGVFYWSRVWWKMPKEVREALDDSQAMVDGALYVAALLYVPPFICLAYAAIDRTLAPGLIRAATAGQLVLGAVASAVVGFGLYRLSLPAHRQFGERVKAMFDCFLADVDVHPVIDVIADKTGEHRIKGEPTSARYRIAWRYL